MTSGSSSLPKRAFEKRAARNPEMLNNDVSDPKPEGFDEEFAEQLEQLEYYSHGDHVEVEVLGVEQPVDGEAVVRFDPPIGEEFTLDMAVPMDPSVETAFTELLDYAGYNYTNAQELVGDRVPAKHTDDGWELHFPEPELSWREQAANAVRERDFKAFGVAFLASSAVISVALWWPIAGLPVMYWIESTDEDVESTPVLTVMIYTLGVIAWFAVSGLIQVVAGMLGFTFPVQLEVVL